MDDEVIPGVTFYLESSDVLPPSTHKPMQARVRVKLLAEVQDMDVFEEVSKQLNGMRIYTTTNFAVEMVNVMKDHHEAESKMLLDTIKQKSESIIRLEQQLSFAQAEVKMLKEHVGSSGILT